LEVVQALQAARKTERILEGLLELEQGRHQVVEAAVAWGQNLKEAEVDTADTDPAAAVSVA